MNAGSATRLKRSVSSRPTTEISGRAMTPSPPRSTKASTRSRSGWPFTVPGRFEMTTSVRWSSGMFMFTATLVMAARGEPSTPRATPMMYGVNRCVRMFSTPAMAYTASAAGRVVMVKG